MMKYYIYRNSTVENLFMGLDAEYSSYNDFSNLTVDAEYAIFFYTSLAVTGSNKEAEEINSYFIRLEFIIKSLPKTQRIIVFTLEEFNSFSLISSDNKIHKAVLDFNNNINTLAGTNPNILIIDFSEFTSKYIDIFEPKFFFYSLNSINPKYSKEFKSWFLNKIREIEGIRKKCIVLDLDNTLWGGIVGEDGINGIKLGNTYPGNIYKYFQEILLSIKNTGILLTICSKNNFDDAMEVFSNHHEMVLRLDDFICCRINWNNKPQNIQSIANELNIGLDAIVFIDDNPIERDLVKFTLPEVVVPDFPKSIYHIPDFIRIVYNNYFKVYNLTDEDKHKTKQYILRKNAEIDRKLFNNIEEYIESLQIKINISLVNQLTLPRAAQLTQKTNQFNLTTKRYTESELEIKLNQGYVIFLLSVSDKFGDSGITGECILKIQNKTVLIDNFLLSCRVLGKNIETLFLKNILNILKNNGIEEVYAEFILSPKNSQTEDFYLLNGFELIHTLENSKKYKLNLNDYNYFVNKTMHVNICEIELNK